MTSGINCDGVFILKKEIKQERNVEDLVNESVIPENYVNIPVIWNNNKIDLNIVKQESIEFETDCIKVEKSSEVHGSCDIPSIGYIPKNKLNKINQENSDTSVIKAETDDFEVYKSTNHPLLEYYTLHNPYNEQVSNSEIGLDIRKDAQNLFELKQEVTDLGIDYVQIDENTEIECKNVHTETCQGFPHVDNQCRMITFPNCERTQDFGKECNICTDVQNCKHLTQDIQQSYVYDVEMFQSGEHKTRDVVKQCGICTDFQNCKHVTDVAQESNSSDVEMLHGGEHTTQDLPKHQCNICCKEFKWKSTLKAHMKIHSGEKPYKCPKCDLRFLRRSVLNLHLKRHEGLKLFQCNSCDAAFVTKGELEEHFNSKHSENKPYKCGNCGKCFATNKSLGRHSITHSEEKPFECDVCSLRYNDAYNLRRHMKVHEKETSDSCANCGRACGNAGALMRHVKVCLRKSGYS